MARREDHVSIAWCGGARVGKGKGGRGKRERRDAGRGDAGRGGGARFCLLDLCARKGYGLSDHGGGVMDEGVGV